MFLGMRPTESAAGAQNWGEKLFREIYLDKDRVSVSCENELLEFFNSSGKLYASFSDFATILHHYFATSAFFQKSKKHLPAALLLLKFNLPKI